MAEYIGCRECDSPYCKGCNLKNLETMLRNGKFDCIMNENRCINTAADVAPVRHGRWVHEHMSEGYAWVICSECEAVIHKILINKRLNYCPNCGAKMDEPDEPEN